MTGAKSVSLATRVLSDKGVEFALHHYRYAEKGGTSAAAGQLGLDGHLIIKTLVMEDDRGAPLIVLMHGDKKVSTKALARAIGARKVRPCDSKGVRTYTGYVVGGTSPFGTRRTISVYVEETVLKLPGILINAGKRGLLAEMKPEVLERILEPSRVRVAR